MAPLSDVPADHQLGAQPDVDLGPQLPAPGLVQVPPPDRSPAPTTTEVPEGTSQPRWLPGPGDGSV